MFSLIGAIIIVLITGFPQNSIGYKWITLEKNMPMPEDAIEMDNGVYVGRVNYYNLVLPAEIHNGTYAQFVHNKKELSKSEFEVLTATEHCEWKKIADMNEVPANVVLAGSAWNNEPIYIGKSTYITFDTKSPYYTNIASFLFSSQKFSRWNDYAYRDGFALICDFKNTWVETSSANVPKNAVSGSTKNDYSEYFIGRLLGPTSWVLGRIIPQRNITIAEYDNVHMESPYAQVLVGDPNQYKWQPSKFGKIPDYAVPYDQNKRGEIRYIVNFYRILCQRLPSELTLHPYYEVLVRNV